MKERVMGYRYNSPPGWPPPPEGWTPPPGWQPDPSWPPAPAGWQFWVDDGAGAEAANAPDHSATPADGASADGGSGDAPTQMMGTPTQNFGTTSAPQTPGGQPGEAASAAGATSNYQYGPSGPLEDPADPPYDTGFLRAGAQQQGAGHPPAGAPPAAGYQSPQQGGYPQGQGGYPQQGGQPTAPGGFAPAQAGGHSPAQGGYAPAQGGYPPAQGGYPGQPEGYPGQSAPDSSGKKKNTGLIVAIVAAVAVVLGLLVWGGIALFGGDDPDPAPTVPPPTAPSTSEPTEEPTEQPTAEPTPEPTEEPTEQPTNDTGGSSGGNDEATTLSLGEEAVIEGTESDPEVTMTVTGVEPWEDSNSMFCSEPELDGFIAIDVEVTTHGSDYEFNVLNLSAADADGESISDVNPFTGLLCENPDALPTELSGGETHTGTIIFDVPDDASYVIWEDWLDFTGESEVFLWEY